VGMRHVGTDHRFLAAYFANFRHEVTSKYRYRLVIYAPNRTNQEICDYIFTVERLCLTQSNLLCSIVMRREVRNIMTGYPRLG
jgi:hypothetical protein